MSKENVEIVRAVLAAPGVDLAGALRSDEQFDAFRVSAQSMLSEHLECYASVLGTQERYEGIDGLRTLWITWVEPWTSYRTEIEDLIELDDRVLALVRDYGRRDELTAEVTLIGASMWTFDGGKIKSATFYADRKEALEAAGLSE